MGKKADTTECATCDGTGHGVSYIRAADGYLIEPECKRCEGTGHKILKDDGAA